MTKLADIFVVLIVGSAMLYLLFGAWMIDKVERLFKRSGGIWLNL